MIVEVARRVLLGLSVCVLWTMTTTGAALADGSLFGSFCITTDDGDSYRFNLLSLTGPPISPLDLNGGGGFSLASDLYSTFAIHGVRWSPPPIAATAAPISGTMVIPNLAPPNFLFGVTEHVEGELIQTVLKFPGGFPAAGTYSKADGEEVEEGDATFGLSVNGACDPVP